jgi:phosphate/sulfate permease
MPSNKTKRILIVWIIIAAFLAGSFAFILWSIFSFDAISTTKSIEIKDETKKGEAYLFMKKDIETNKNSINKVYDYIIKSDDVVNFMQKLEDLAKSNSLKSEVKSVSFEGIAGNNISNIESMRILLDVTGEWKNVEYFLEILENYPISLDIRKFSFNKTDITVKNKKITQWTGSFDLSVIKVKDK